MDVRFFQHTSHAAELGYRQLRVLATSLGDLLVGNEPYRSCEQVNDHQVAVGCIGCFRGAGRPTSIKAGRASDTMYNSHNWALIATALIPGRLRQCFIQGSLPGIPAMQTFQVRSHAEMLANSLTSAKQT